MAKAGGGVFRGGGGGAYTGAVKVSNLFKSKTIPHEEPSGQLAMFKPSQIMTSGMKMRGVVGRGSGRTVTSSPPFRVSGRTRPGPRARVKALARAKELREKAFASTDRVPMPTHGWPVHGPKPAPKTSLPKSGQARKKIAKGAKGRYHMPGGAGGEWSKGYQKGTTINPLNKKGYYN